jgi:hypothetical protein
MQYPRRSVESLKKMLTPGGEVIFVDNEGVSQKLLERKGYEHCFADRFAGDFGHCTPEGNRVLAENLADVILENVLNE